MNNLRLWPAPAATGGSQLSAPIPTAYCCGNMAAGIDANEGANRNMDTVANANVDEIATFVEEVQHLEELDEAIVRIESEIGNSRNPEFEAYRLARVQNPTYVSSRDFTIRFLRAEFYDAEKAAARMFDYLKMKREIFGEEKLTKDIVLDDLDEDGREFLERGGLQVLPRPDAAGRPVVFGHAVLNVNAGRRDIESAKKAYFYFWTSLSEDVNTRQGVVGIIWRVHNPPLPDKNLVDYLSRIWRCAPIRLTDYYLCYGGSKTLDKFLWSMLVSWFAGKSVQPRLYFGETVEVMYKLKTTHGIQCLPIHLGLQPRIHNTDHLNGWMARRRSIDQNKQVLIASTTSSNLTITSEIFNSGMTSNSVRPSIESTPSIVSTTSIQSMENSESFMSLCDLIGGEIGNDNHGDDINEFQLMNEPLPPMDSFRTSFESMPSAESMDSEMSDTNLGGTEIGNDNPGAVNSSANDVNESQPMNEPLPPMDSFRPSFESMPSAESMESEMSDRNLGGTEIGNDNPGAVNSSANDVNENQLMNEMLPSRDILLGQGRHNREGNKWYRDLISQEYENYESLDRNGRTTLTREIVTRIRNDNRKFWIQKGGNWVEVDDDIARKKVASNFRDERKRRAEADAVATLNSLSGDEQVD